MKIHLDGELREIKEGSRLRDLLPDFKEGFSVAVIKSAGIHESETASIRLLTTSGEIVVELNESADKFTGDAGFIIFFQNRTMFTLSDGLTDMVFQPEIFQQK
jgi:UPF0288 family protein (methanogenesis marker protein 3)